MSTKLHAHLLSAPHSSLEKEAIAFLQQSLCAQKGCGTCLECRQISEKTHHSVIWIAPEKRYSVDDLAIIFEKTQFGLNDDELFFFVITQADFLNTFCANSLLKIVEEPPAGYNFLFLAERPESVLPTIRSRCVFTRSTTVGIERELPSLVHHFKSFQSDPVSFTKEVGQCSMTELECITYVDDLLRYWIDIYKRALEQQQTPQAAKAHAMVTLMKNALKKPPAPGSSKIFWKHLFLEREQLFS